MVNLGLEASSFRVARHGEMLSGSCQSDNLSCQTDKGLVVRLTNEQHSGDDVVGEVDGEGHEVGVNPGATKGAVVRSREDAVEAA